MRTKLLLLAMALVVSALALAPPVTAQSCTDGCEGHEFVVCCPGHGCIHVGPC